MAAGRARAASSGPFGARQAGSVGANYLSRSRRGAEGWRRDGGSPARAASPGPYGEAALAKARSRQGAGGGMAARRLVLRRRVRSGEWALAKARSVNDAFGIRLRTRAATAGGHTVTVIAGEIDPTRLGSFAGRCGEKLVAMVSLSMWRPATRGWMKRETWRSFFVGHQRASSMFGWTHVAQSPAGVPCPVRSVVT